LVAPVVVVGVDGVFAEDFAGGVVDDGDVVGVDQDGDWLSGVGGADAEVVHPAGAAEADFAVAVDVVGADPVVRAVGVVGWGGFGGCGVGVGGSVAGKSPVRPVGVVEVPEPVELGLEVGEGGCGGLGGEPAFQSLVEAFDLAGSADGWGGRSFG
jgi:hypothetical protein